MGLAWNCRGLSNALSPTIPKIRALVSNNYFDFLFIMETKCNVSSVSPIFRSFGFDKTVGVDALGASGGLWVGWRREAKMRHVYSCIHFVVLLVEIYNGLLWYLVLFYGAPSSSKRASVLSDLECRLSSFQNELVDIPFKGPQFTWCNNQKGQDRVYERLDKAMGSKDWFTFFPNTGLKHYPIQISDHAPIELDFNLISNGSRKPYKLDSWALEHEECVKEVQKAWLTKFKGSPAFQVTRKLAVFKQRMKSWTLDKRQD
ncbi:uncharacterized protein LOC141617667 [Silene latifolia]|uniref:uncharacterized protein LOC141617667 n=1 Tax=Silene latifolia TaxID=37657 RepID=UPI003D775F01